MNLEKIQKSDRSTLDVLAKNMSVAQLVLNIVRRNTQSTVAEDILNDIRLCNRDSIS